MRRLTKSTHNGERVTAADGAGSSRRDGRGRSGPESRGSDRLAGTRGAYTPFFFSASLHPQAAPIPPLHDPMTSVFEPLYYGAGALVGTVEGLSR